MGFFSSKKGSIISDYFMPTEDIGPIKAGDATEVALYDGHLEMKNMLVKQPVTLNYSQVTDVYYGAETEIVEKNKSSIGRAVAGGLLFGGVGAVVGAISGTGKKEKKVTKIVLVVSYTAADGSERFLPFEDTRLLKGPKLQAKLKELCGIKTAGQIGPTAL